MNKPLFSIITISFNSAATIERTIQSVLDQTFTDYEYIIVDGASKDSTVEKIQSYESRFNGRMSWISEPDNGIYNAMNKGIKMANGQIIGIINSDDWLETDTLELLQGFVKKNNLSIEKPLILTGCINYKYPDGTKQLFRTSYKRYSKNAEALRMGLNHPATFVTSELYRQIGHFDENYYLYADADLFIRCYREKVEIHFLDVILANMSDGGASAKPSKRSMADIEYRYRKFGNNEFQIRIKLLRDYLYSLLKYYMPTPLMKIIRCIKSALKI